MTENEKPSTESDKAPIEHFNIDDLDLVKQQRRNQREFDRERREGWSLG